MIRTSPVRRALRRSGIRPMDIQIHIDGGARGNPGPAGAGVVLTRGDGSPLLEAGYFLGRMTNNVAEYTALLRALESAEQIGAKRLDIASDSELLVRQINGEYRVRNEGLKGLFAEACDRLSRFSQWRLRHVRREANARADELANLAMDAGEDVVVLDRQGAVNDKADQATTKGATARARKSHSSAVHEVHVRCVQPPSEEVCPSPCSSDAIYAFTDVTPSGICIHAAPTILQAVFAVREGSGKQEVTCARKGCGARFVVQ